MLHGQVDGDVTALRNQADAAVDAFATVFVRPKRDAVKVIQITVAIWADHDHVAGGFAEARLQSDSLTVNFCETGGEADREGCGTSS